MTSNPPPEENFDDVVLAPDNEVLELAPTARGKIWTYLAVDPVSNFILTYMIGARTYSSTQIFAHRLSRTLKRDEEGSLVTKPTIVTDGMPAYVGAFEEVFHNEVNFAQYVKQYTKEKGRRERFNGADRRVIVGATPSAWINTTFVERQNLNARMGNRRLTRRSNAFSKALLDHERHMALWIAYRNYVWEQRPKRPPAGSAPGARWRKRGTAANELGADQKVWEVSDILQRVDAYHAALRGVAANDNAEPEESDEPVHVDDVDVQLVPPFWVYHNLLASSAKVHKAECANCRDGQGRGGSRPGTAVWTPFYSQEAAMKEAEKLAPERNSICAMCIGEYRRRGRTLMRGSS